MELEGYVQKARVRQMGRRGGRTRVERKTGGEGTRVTQREEKKGEREKSQRGRRGGNANDSMGGNRGNSNILDHFLLLNPARKGQKALKLNFL